MSMSAPPLNNGSLGAHDALQLEGPHEYPALGAPAVARAGVFCPRVPVSLSASGGRRPVERVTPALVSALLSASPKYWRPRRLTFPGFTRIQPWLVSCAAAGIMIVTSCATMFHLSRGEVSSAVTTVVLLAMATFVAYMRWRVAPIQPRRVA